MSNNKLQQLRQLMREKKIDYYYVPTRDDHFNEYVPSHWQRRAWLTGFTGSYGEALIGLEQAYLWTDSRYYLQAESQLNANDFQLMKQISGATAPLHNWLAENTLQETVAVDAKLLSMSEHRALRQSLSTTHSQLMMLSENLIDLIWENRPPLQCEPILILPEKYTGLSVTEKINALREEMKKMQADALILSLLDEIAWLFNIRGNDIPYNPLVISYAIITQHESILLTDLRRIHKKEMTDLVSQSIALQPYDAFSHYLKNLSGTVWIDPRTLSCWIASQLTQATLIEKPTPIALRKAIKNKIELSNAREAHRLDAIAMVKWLAWLENHWRNGVDEISVADQLEAFRREEPRCQSLSFQTICGFADHGAIVHYAATQKSRYTIDDSNLLLIDSGGQYFEGTTDITRVIHLGRPTAEQKKHFTLVLKAHLALRHTPFPAGICGEHVNTLARAPLWSQGMDFGHGTGHGVGAYLCVHEGPQRISYAASGVPLKPGMIVSNEPGLYFTGKYGIRIENLCEIVEVMPAEKSMTGHGPFYGLSDLTMVPYARNLIDINLLTKHEIQWINEYHQRIYSLLEKTVDTKTRQCLKQATLSID